MMLCYSDNDVFLIDQHGPSMDEEEGKFVGDIGKLVAHTVQARVGRVGQVRRHQVASLKSLSASKKPAEFRSDRLIGCAYSVLNGVSTHCSHHKILSGSPVFPLTETLFLNDSVFFD